MRATVWQWAEWPIKHAASLPDPDLMLTTFEFVAAWMRSKANTERGASLVEYALLLALIAVVCIVAITALGKKASGNFSNIDSNLN